MSRDRDVPCLSVMYKLRLRKFRMSGIDPKYLRGTNYGPVYMQICSEDTQASYIVCVLNTEIFCVFL